MYENLTISLALALYPEYIQKFKFFSSHSNSKILAFSTLLLPPGTLYDTR